jgi:hypothetical protein
MVPVYPMWEKISTNKLKQIDENTGRQIWPKIAGPWCGFDALRWCNEREDRVLAGRYRPMNDWEMPASPYYD